jgi:hypothetical protein
MGADDTSDAIHLEEMDWTAASAARWKPGPFRLQYYGFFSQDSAESLWSSCHQPRPPVIFIYNTRSIGEFDTLKLCRDVVGGDAEWASRINPIIRRAENKGWMHSLLRNPLLELRRICQRASSDQSNFAGLLCLPLELQREILRLCLVSPRPITDHKLTQHGISLHVLRVCRLFYDQGMRIFWGENSFAVSGSIFLIADLSWLDRGNRRVVSQQDGLLLAESLGGKYFEAPYEATRDIKAIYAEILREFQARDKFRSVLLGPPSEQQV